MSFNQHSGYHPVGLQHSDIDMERPAFRQTQLDGDYSATPSPLVASTSYPQLPPVRLSDEAVRSLPDYDAELAAGLEGLPYNSHSRTTSRHSSWDLYGAGRKWVEHEYEEYNEINASQVRLNDDIPNDNKVSLSLNT